MSSRRWRIWFLDLFRENWLYKIVALIVAAAVWATTIYGQKDTIMIKTLNVEYILRPQYIIANNYLRTAQVKVAGPHEALRTFAMSASPLVINLASQKVGEDVIPLLASNVEVPLGVKVLSIRPNFIKIRIRKAHVRSHSTKGAVR